MIGGALAPQRSDYDEIRRENPQELIYVCDRDFLGESALQKVSRYYGAAMQGIMFGDSFPESWDMADPIPEKLFSPTGRYTGVSLQDLTLPATWATKVINAGEKSRPAYGLRDTFLEEWFHCVSPDVYVHAQWPHRIYNTSQFNDVVRPFSDIDDTARLMRMTASHKSAALLYDPGIKSGLYMDKGKGRFINTHCPSSIKPEKGDYTPWLEFMTFLVPDEGDRTELMRWCATLIARPDIKMLYGVLLISEAQGVGKGTLGEKILAPLVGELNTSYPSEVDITESNFSYWLAHKRLAIVHEIYSGHSSKAYNKLKSIITDRNLTVNIKFRDAYILDNTLHIFACSNSKRAIQLSSDDRRWFVPKITEQKQKPTYWAKFFDWLHDDGGLAKIAYWAEDFLKKNASVLRGDSAPDSAAKRDMVVECYSEGMAHVQNKLAAVRQILDSDKPADVKIRERWEAENKLKDGAVFFLDHALVQSIKDNVYQGRHHDKLEKPLTVRKVAKAEGWAIGQEKINGSNSWGPMAHNSKIIASDQRIVDIPYRNIDFFPLNPGDTDII